ncbi:MAG: hypothetical protein IH586_16560 [Anaerolineaceae bacterium]|nr:hypothetical protein [Anaerolineaceae bacterium]
MKRIITGMSLLIMIFIVSCTLSPQGLPKLPAIAVTATISSDQMQTQISEMLTVMPTATAMVGDGGISTATPVLPTLEIGGAVITATIEASPTSTAATESQVEAATATPVPPTNTPNPTATTQPQGPTATLPQGDPRSRLGAPKSTDPMDKENFWIWPTGSDQFSRAEFTNGTQVITSLDPKDGWRLANPLGREFTNTYLEATFKTGACAGLDHYGIILRVPVIREPDQGYLFSVSCDGRYSLRRWNGEILPKGEMKKLVEWTANSAINSGPNQTNRLGIFAVGKRLILYVNGKLLTEAQDSNYSSGYFGVLLGHDATANFSVQLDEMSYWENPTP